MDRLPDLIINFADPDDVKAKLPEARKGARSLRAEALELLNRAESWDRLVHVLENISIGSATDSVDGDGASAGGGELQPPKARRTATGSPRSVDVVVGILDEAGAPMTVAE